MLCSRHSVLCMCFHAVPKPNATDSDYVDIEIEVTDALPLQMEIELHGM